MRTIENLFVAILAPSSRPWRLNFIRFKRKVRKGFSQSALRI